MSLKLDDLLTKKKEPTQILDFSKCTANSKEELKKLLEKVPEYKIKLEKVKPEDIKIREKKFTFKTPKKDLKSKRFPFANPVPLEMRSLHLDDLYSVNIQWKMLTSLRPKSKMDEEYFSRLIDVGKLTLSTREKEKLNPDSKYIKKTKNRSGIMETKIISCYDCGEEFCLGETCRIFPYDSYQRINTFAITSTELVTEKSESTKKTKGKKKKNKRKKLFKKKQKIAVPNKNKTAKRGNTQDKLLKQSSTNKKSQQKIRKTSKNAAVSVTKLKKLQSQSLKKLKMNVNQNDKSKSGKLVVQNTKKVTKPKKDLRENKPDVLKTDKSNKLICDATRTKNKTEQTKARTTMKKNKIGEIKKVEKKI